MGLFSKTPKLTAEEIKQQKEDINECLNNKDYKEALRLCKQLDKEAPNEAADIFAMMYFMGWGVKEDEAKALEYARKAVKLHPDDGDSWYLGGVILMNADEYEDSIDWLETADQVGASDALEMLAKAHFTYAGQLRESILMTLDAQKYTTVNNLACHHLLKTLDSYSQLYTRNRKLDFSDCVVCGRTAGTLYTLACNGEITERVVNNNGFKSFLMTGLDTAKGAHDEEKIQEVWSILVNTGNVIDESGFSVVAEYLRALGNLLEAKRSHSAEIFYCARWHMKRIGQLRVKLSQEELDEVEEGFPELNALFEKMNKKYGRLVTEMIVKGQMPNISASYLDGKTPEVESCPGFMSMIEKVKNAPEEVEQEKPKKSGFLGGLFGRR